MHYISQFIERCNVEKLKHLQCFTYALLHTQITVSIEQKLPGMLEKLQSCSKFLQDDVDTCDGLETTYSVDDNSGSSAPTPECSDGQCCLNYTSSDLNPAAIYTVSVTAVNAVGKSAPTSTIPIGMWLK